MMRVDVLIFGPQASLVGSDRVPIALAGDRPSVSDVIAALGVAAPALAPSLDTSRLAVNHAYASEDQVILPGDEVALIGMVSGG